MNLHQLPPLFLRNYESSREPQLILEWIEKNSGHDISVCDCCGDGESWYGEPGEHYNETDPRGPAGPYAYNGGLCECN